LANGVDPSRVLLLTFSRLAAAEMIGRVGRVARRVMGAAAEAITASLEWAGTFHGIGARLLREHAGAIGLDPGFTIHDREDSADLINLVRNDFGFSRTEERFPLKGTCLSIYSRCVNSQMPIEEVIPAYFPWCSAWGEELKELFQGYVETKQRQNVLDYDDLLLYWAQMMSDHGISTEIGARFDHVLVDEYQDTNRVQASILLC
jgi:DNA helicase-2/ATP-dependent DNA helicase PcrA